MFMVPDAVRADPLFIDETMRRIHLNDLRQQVSGMPNNGETVYSIISPG